MTLQLGSKAPDFEQDSSEGTIKFHEWSGDKWVLFFSHPKDFTPVCTTELGAVAKLKPEFDRRNAKALALSVDPASSHRDWISDIEDTQGTKLNYPIVADVDQKVSKLYGMIHPDLEPKVTVRSVFFIDPNKKIRAMLTYPPSTGRNFNELLRVLDSLQLTDSHSVATPANWEDGQDVVIAPTITDPEDLKRRFPKGHKELRPYLRLTPQPNK